MLALEPLREQPAPERRRGVRARPRALVADARVERQPRLAAAGAELLDEDLRPLRRHDLVGGAVEGPERRVAEAAERRRLPRGSEAPAARDRDERGEPLRVPHPELPGAEAAHAEAGQVDAPRVDRITRFDAVEQPDERLEQRLPGVVGE